jgi:hypothetical protein
MGMRMTKTSHSKRSHATLAPGCTGRVLSIRTATFARFHVIEKAIGMTIHIVLRLLTQTTKNTMSDMIASTKVMTRSINFASQRDSTALTFVRLSREKIIAEVESLSQVRDCKLN